MTEKANKSMYVCGYQLVQYPDQAAFRVFKDGEYVGDSVYGSVYKDRFLLSIPGHPVTLDFALNEPSSQSPLSSEDARAAIERGDHIKRKQGLL